MLEAAGVEVDDVKVKSLVAALQNIDIAKVLEQALAAPVAAVPAAPAAPAEEEKKEEEATEEEEEKEVVSEEELAEGLGALFG